MITRRQIREKVMQAVYACLVSGEKPRTVFDLQLKEMHKEICDWEEKKKQTGDAQLLETLYYHSMEQRERYDKMIQSKAENWELDRIALLGPHLDVYGHLRNAEYGEYSQ